MTVRRILATTALTGAMLVGGIWIGSIASASNTAPSETPAQHSLSSAIDESPAKTQPTFLRNAAGHTYGSAAGVAWEALPDLVLVITDEGKEGYVLKDVLFPPPPTSLEAALSTDPVVGRVNATTEDGKTVIGTFTLDAGSSSEK